MNDIDILYFYIYIYIYIYINFYIFIENNKLYIIIIFWRISMLTTFVGTIIHVYHN